MDPRIDVLGLESRALAEAASRILPSGAGLAGKIYARVFATGRIEPEIFGASAASARAWKASFRAGLLRTRRVVAEGEASPESAARKATMATDDGLEIECVLVPMLQSRGTRHTLCISSQAGCRMGCAFCETGLRGLSRDLGAAEIVAQAVTARVALGWEFSNIVFMGMGEPLDNLRNVAAALRAFADPSGLGLSWERMTVCSSGPEGGIPALRELGFKRLNLSISLNAAEDGKRNSLMPVNRSGGLARLERELAAYPQRRNFALAANYCLIPGINDGREDAALAASFCARVGRCLINLIPYNPGSAFLARATSPAETERFAAWLREEGCLVKRRESKGRSIMAGCGQLGGGPGPEGDSSL